MLRAQIFKPRAIRSMCQPSWCESEIKSIAVFALAQKIVQMAWLAAIDFQIGYTCTPVVHSNLDTTFPQFFKADGGKNKVNFKASTTTLQFESLGGVLLIHVMSMCSQPLDLVLSHPEPRYKSSRGTRGLAGKRDLWHHDPAT